MAHTPTFHPNPAGNYNYGSLVRQTRFVSGTVAEGRRHANTRKGQAFTAENRVVIENRVEGRTRTFSVIGKDGRTEARLAPDAVMY